MNNLLTIIRKELKRFFTDSRMLVTLILPGLMIFVLYTIMGDTLNNTFDPSKQTYTLKIENEPEGFHFFEGDNYIYLEDNLPKSEYEARVRDQELDLYVVYPEDFLAKLENGEKPEVVISYNAASVNSSAVAGGYRQYLIEGLSPLEISSVNFATDNDMSSSIIASLIPFLLIVFLFTGSMAVAPESIAGEKERGTIANLLITPVRRETIALGKIIALSIVALVSATSSFLGILLSLPKLTGGTEVSLAIYGFSTYALIFLVLISTILIFTVLISIISTYAKSIKEASGLAMPLMIIIMLVGVSAMMGKATANTWLYLIPVYNSVQSLLSIFSLEPFNALNFGLTIISNLLVTGLGVYLLTQMFDNERIMFRK